MSGDWRDFTQRIPGDPVLDAALDVFVEFGYHGSNVKAIARRSGLSVPGLYHHSPSKQDLLMRIYLLFYEDLARHLRGAMRDAGDDPVRRLANFVECMSLACCYRRDLMFIAMSEMRSLETHNFETIQGPRHANLVLLERIIADGIRQGLFNAGPTLDAMAILTLCTAIVQWYKPERPQTPEEIAGQYVQYALQIVGAVPRSSRIDASVTAGR